MKSSSVLTAVILAATTAHAQPIDFNNFANAQSSNLTVLNSLGGTSEVVAEAQSVTFDTAVTVDSFTLLTRENFSNEPAPELVGFFAAFDESTNQITDLIFSSSAFTPASQGRFDPFGVGLDGVTFNPGETVAAGTYIFGVTSLGNESVNDGIANVGRAPQFLGGSSLDGQNYRLIANNDDFSTLTTGTFGTRANEDLILGVNGSVVPEPSTYAAIAGVLALGLAVVRRRFRRQA
ncbi:MAG: PEP-CTERM sorting domain-containing protein [Opitutales bacterium]